MSHQTLAPAFARRSRGIVMILTLLSVILLAGLVMFVLNLGRASTRRVQLQNAADSGAIAGAGWVARSLNTIAMNNVNMVRLISLVNVLDGMPDAARFTILEHEMLLEALGKVTGSGFSDPWVANQVQDMKQELNDELNVLRPMDAYFQSYDVTRLTFYDGPGGRGQLWRAMEGMDELNISTIQNLGELAQYNFNRGADVNLDRMDGEKVAFMAPLLPTVPWTRGEFEDFQRPVLNGILPEKIDDKEFNRGPFDTVFGWRYLIGGQQPGYWVGGGGVQNPPGGRGSVPIGSGGGGGGSRGTFVSTGPRDPDAYGTYSFTRWMLDKVGNFAHDHLPHGRFMYWENRFTNYKLGYLWPGNGARFVIEPVFETDFPKAVQIAENNRSDVKETWFLAIEMKSKFARGQAGFMSPGSYSYYVTPGQDDRNTPRTVRLRGWNDPRTWNAEQIGNYVWRDEWDYKIYFDPTIGIPLVRDAQGNLVSQPVYRIDTFTFLAINIGPEYEVRNPHNFSSRSGLPAPTDLDHTRLRHDNEAARKEYLNFLSIAQVDDRAVAWPSRFAGNKPYPNQVAVALALVFNNHSWDLWTQMWEAQLRPVEDIDGWIRIIESGSADAPPEVPAQAIDNLTTYLKSLRGLFDLNSSSSGYPQ
ncbi:MAG: Tad domain-containing protein [Phycisphaeraceae bacterium]